VFRLRKGEAIVKLHLAGLPLFSKTEYNEDDGMQTQIRIQTRISVSRSEEGVISKNRSTHPGKYVCWIKVRGIVFSIWWLQQQVFSPSHACKRQGKGGNHSGTESLFQMKCIRADREAWT